MNQIDLNVQKGLKKSLSRPQNIRVGRVTGFFLPNNICNYVALVVGLQTILFDCFDALLPSHHFFSHVGPISRLPRLNQRLAADKFCFLLI